MSRKEYIDPVTGEKFVEQTIDLGFKNLKHLKTIPIFLGALLALQLIIIGLIGIMCHSLSIVIKEHLYVVCHGPDPHDPAMKEQYGYKEKK